VDILKKDNKVFSFIGHRPKDLGGFDEDDLINKWVKFSLKVMVGQVVKVHKRVSFLCGGQPGTELWAAEEVLRYKNYHEDNKVNMGIVLPFPEISGRNHEGNPVSKKPWPLVSHNRLEKACEEADEVNILSEGPYSAWRIRSRDEWVISRSHGLITVLKSGVETGPIINAIKFAEKCGVQVCVIDPITERIYTN